MPKLLLDLPEIAGSLEQVDGQGMPCRVDAEFRRQMRPLYGCFPDPL